MLSGTFRRALGLTGGIALGLLHYGLWFGDKNLPDLLSLRAQTAGLEAENTQLQNQLTRLAAHVQDLKHGKQALETLARAEFGLVKPGETFYQVIDDLIIDD